MANILGDDAKQQIRRETASACLKAARIAIRCLSAGLIVRRSAYPLENELRHAADGRIDATEAVLQHIDRRVEGIVDLEVSIRSHTPKQIRLAGAIGKSPLDLDEVVGPPWRPRRRWPGARPAQVAA